MRILKDDLVEKKQRKIILMQKEINELERHKVLLKAQSDGYASELLSLQKQCIRHKKEKAEIFENIEDKYVITPTDDITDDSAGKRYYFQGNIWISKEDWEALKKEVNNA